MKKFSELEKKLRIFFEDKDLLAQAFCHRSYLNENRGVDFSHNERLEFLGDAVLELIVTQYLYDHYPSRSEGDLTNWRAALVNSRALSELAEELGFNDFLLLSKGEQETGGRARRCILADTFEAFIGALFLDLGYDKARKFVENSLLPKIELIIKNGLFKDPKSVFQEKAQEGLGVTPIYKVLKTWGPDHTKHFLIGAFLGERKIAEGEGLSKQEAEEAAAAKALKKEDW